jgi:hypothetical protein
MKGDLERWMISSVRAFTSHIPIPQGCLTMVALLLGVLMTVVFSSVAIGIRIAILR